MFVCRVCVCGVVEADGCLGPSRGLGGHVSFLVLNNNLLVLPVKNVCRCFGGPACRAFPDDHLGFIKRLWTGMYVIPVPRRA